MSALQQKVNLKPLHTFGIEVFADYFGAFTSTQEFINLYAEVKNKNLQHLILGGGSNVLFTQDFKGAILLNQIRGIEIISESEDDITLFVASGENWHQTVLYTINHGWGGLENLSLIPGSVGAAPIQNIGAYGVEICQVLESVTYLDIDTQQTHTLPNTECNFGYRNSIFKNQLKGKILVLGITLKLNKNNHKVNTRYGAIATELEKRNITHPTAKDVSNVVIDIRKSKLPYPEELGNAGSFFKNPVIDTVAYQQLLKSYPELPGYSVSDFQTKVPAGWLIEQLGWKGKVVGETGSHKNQALVLVNYGNAQGTEVWQLAQQIISSVKETFKIELEPEVNVI